MPTSAGAKPQSPSVQIASFSHGPVDAGQSAAEQQATHGPSSVQRWKPGRHSTVQSPASQTARAFAAPGQTLWHSPQCSTSVGVSTQPPSQQRPPAHSSPSGAAAKNPSLPGALQIWQGPQSPMQLFRRRRDAGIPGPCRRVSKTPVTRGV